MKKRFHDGYCLKHNKKGLIVNSVVSRKKDLGLICEPSQYYEKMKDIKIVKIKLLEILTKEGLKHELGQANKIKRRKRSI